ncbi:MAG: phosphate signaling complex protein PhoU [Proteobacteria bacterium]|nr:phosphate signaling complex protein PhoU [Pseudomonadota bacterium]MBU1582379.1 phosphate signaling complex protein PhoU [Pseudomonadota bacterium]MBU2454116.1 phosphate signaling complex protein PhoU [Pseudomonadota bacterium]MBU2627493.1 phosphate signaling complex protein PhoU [Pseudomonadota bacterium]
MAGHLQREIEKIKKEILSLGAMVEDRLQKAIHAIKTQDLALAEKIIDTDFEIDEREIEVEEECLKILALYQPVATDLRFLVAVIKINNDLERIADYAANIAKRYKASFRDHKKFKYDYGLMADQAAKMLRLSLDALVRMDVDMAYDVRDMDKEVNLMRNDAYDSMKKDIQTHPEMVEEIINMYLISRHLERIGDHTTNIAEEVIYLIEGEIVRHT